MEKKKVIVAVSNDLVADRRVDKECTTLHNHGYDVLLMGCYKKGRPEIKRPYGTFRFGLLFTHKFAFYAELNIRLFFQLLKREKDLILCNDTDLLPACYLASKAGRTPLVFDAHDLFPEVPEVVSRPFVRMSRPFVRMFWRKIEDIFFPRLKYCYTVCQSIAKYYNYLYGTDMKVVRNIPSYKDVPEKTCHAPIDTGGRHLLLYQGAVNKGRGVDWLIKAMPLLDDCILYICGDGDLLDEMKRLAKDTGVNDRVIFTGRIPAAELDYYTMQAEVGFVLLDNIGLSYYYSLPNRIFDYMRFGVPVIATDFPEISAIVKKHNTGLLTRDHSPQHLAALIREITDTKTTLFDKDKIRQTAKDFTWENEEAVILDTVSKAINDK